MVAQGVWFEGGGGPDLTAEAVVAAAVVCMCVCVRARARVVVMVSHGGGEVVLVGAGPAEGLQEDRHRQRPIRVRGHHQQLPRAVYIHKQKQYIKIHTHAY